MRDIDQECQWLLAEKYDGVKNTAYYCDAERVCSGEPVAYVIGFSSFLGCRINLASHPLIPRAETEYWAERLIAQMLHTDVQQPLQILDLCAGSGCIGIGFLRHIPDSFVTFVEIDSRHLTQISENCRANDVREDRYVLVRSDLFGALSPEKKYDYIVANPPYVALAKKDRVALSVAKYEPALALYAGDTGLDLIRRILEEAGAYLAPRGVLVMECDDHHGQQIDVLARSFGWHCTVKKDQCGKDRYAVCTQAV